MSDILNSRWLICRICLKSENNKLYNIFEPIEDEGFPELGKTLLDKIELCGAIKLIKQSSLPNGICNRCVLLLRAAYKFRDLCQQSQDQLQQFITALPQTYESENTLEINFDSDAEEQKAEVQEEVENVILNNVDYVLEENVAEYDLSDESATNEAGKSEDYYASIEEEDVELQCFSDESSQYVVEEVDAKQFVDADNENIITTYKYEEDITGDSVVIKEQHKKPGQQEKKPASRRKPKKYDDNFNGIYSCTLCDNTYTDRTKYTNHIKIHAKDKPHECEICNKRFSTTPQLSRHMNSHTGNRPYKCQYCEACFGDPSTKIKHERIHTNERPYKCNMCDKAFAYSNVLKVHMMTHTGEKPHTCHYCGKAFSQVHHKNAHEKRHLNVNMVLMPNSPDIVYMEEDEELNDFKIEEIN